MSSQILAFLLLFQFSVVFNQTSDVPGSSASTDSLRTGKTAKILDENVIFKSTDGGETWLEADDNSVAAGETGTLTKTYSGYFLQKVNGIGLWLPTYMKFEVKDIQRVFQTSNAVFLVSGNGLLKSSDNGKNWRQVYNDGWVMKVVESGGVLMATTQRGIIRSTDQGENWDNVLNEGGVAIAIECIKGGFAAITCNTDSETRRVRTSYDGGKSWQAIDAGLPASLYIASVNEVGEYLFCGHPAGIYRSADKGKTWKLLLPGIENKVYNLSVSGSVIYATPKSQGC